jgi:hypothetical protein
VGIPDFPTLFLQPGLLALNHQVDVAILLQNCGDVNMEMPRYRAIGFLENLQYNKIKEIFV